MDNNIEYDVEAEFKFNEDVNYFDGCRPIHLIDGNYTTGLHKYIEQSDNKVIGKIAFICPEAYPNSLWIGKRIEMYDGSRKIGVAIILKIYNKILEARFL